MSTAEWQVVATLPGGGIEAEILRGLLEANEIPVVLSQEGAARAIGLGVGPLAETQLLVPKARLEEALDLLRAYRAGELEIPE
ncbi:MAG TPA: hypothetical protein ENJ02_04235 [Chloroflexi bacterium]|nr:hypothetical protein [Chloroflexota bacterium]